MSFAPFFFVGILLLLGCQQTLPPTPEAAPSRFAFADRVLRAEGASGRGFGDPKRAVNGVRGAGDFTGGTDVFSLDQARDGAIDLGWSRGRVCDGPGDDFAVFENAFFLDRSRREIFLEPFVVSVSADGKTFVDFPHAYRGNPEEASLFPEDWVGFGGLTPVRFHEENHGLRHGIDPFDAEKSGGDRFDLQALGDSPGAARIRREGVVAIRFTAAALKPDPKTGENFLSPGEGFADIDGVYARCFTDLPERKPTP